MRKAIIFVIIYYVIGSVLSYITYLIFGHPYIHAPALYHLLIILILFTGGIWGIYALTQIKFYKEKKEYYKWLGIINLMIVFLFILWAIIDINYLNSNNF